MPEPERRAYLPELDGLRLVAFLLVFGFHGGLPWVGEVVSLATLPLFALAAATLGPDAAGPVADLGPALSRGLLRNGWVGVQLFFILSGYLITTLLLKEEAAHGRIDLRAFWMRRILRIWPLYFLTVALTFLVLPTLDGRMADAGRRAFVGRELPWFLAFLGNWAMIRLGPAPDDAVSILWSVCVEEQFYLLCPLLVAVVPRRLRLAIVLAGMAAAVGYRASLAAGRPPQYVLQYDAFAQLDTMLSGVALALVLPGREARGWIRKAAAWVVLALALAVFARPGLAHGTPWRQTWDFVAIWAVGMGVVALPVLVDGRWRRCLAARPAAWLGRISYGLYMFHEVAFWCVRAVRNDAARTLVALGLTIGLGAASYYGFERPFLKLKRRWTRVPSRPV